MTIALPAAIRTYVDAGNAFDLETLAGAFAADAFVNDARHEYWGIDAIQDWLARELVGDKVTMDVTEVTEHYGTLTVAAVMDGLYDKTGLPDPLVLTHYFTVHDDRIVRLIIILNEPR
jgi:hypothetical protein